jgi:hypothetical protein
MNISQDIRRDAEAHNEVDARIEQIADKFRAAGGEIYVPAAE